MKYKAFTLIELLVVIAIVSILSGFVFIQTNNAINSGKDAKRKSDIELLSAALVSYSTEHYDATPVTDFDGCTINGDCPAEVNETFEVYMGTLPAEPNPGAYYTYQSDGTDCTISASLSTGETYQYVCSTDDTIVGSPVAGTCGSKANGSSSGYPSSQTDWTSDTTYCASTASSTTPAFPATPGSSVSWSCPGTYLGGTVSCTAYHALDGVCGSGTANTYTIPTANFCSTGTASSVSGSGPWSWTCAGVYGGTTPTCVANKSIDGVCGSSNGGNYYNTSSISAPCSVGSTSAYSGSGPWSWTCAGVYGGTTPTCTANKKVDGVCGTSDGTNVYTIPTANLCSSGTSSSVSGSGPWSWTCIGQNTGSTVSCTANKKVDGVCGSSNGSYLGSPPTSNLCSSGTASASGSWSWTCAGANGGSSSGTCTAYQKQSCSAVGGTTATCGTQTCCIVSGSSCPTGYSSSGYTTTAATTCGEHCFSNPGSAPCNGGYCYGTCTTGSHTLGAVGRESCTAYARHRLWNGSENSDDPLYYVCVSFSCSANVTQTGCY